MDFAFAGWEVGRDYGPNPQISGNRYNRGMRLLSSLASATVVVVALAAGCSSSNNNKDGSSGSGGDGPATKLVGLSRADLNQLCPAESANGTETVSCGADAAVNITPLGVCTSITPD